MGSMERIEFLESATTQELVSQTKGDEVLYVGGRSEFLGENDYGHQDQRPGRPSPTTEDTIDLRWSWIGTSGLVDDGRRLNAWVSLTSLYNRVCISGRWGRVGVVRGALCGCRGPDS